MAKSSIPSLDRAPVAHSTSRAEMDALIDHLSVIGRSLRHTQPEDLQHDLPFPGHCPDS
jgi:hypothetical protein